MIYYKAKRNVYLFRSKRQAYVIFENELLTVKELERIGGGISPVLYTRVDINKNSTKKFNGIRLENN